MSKVDVILSGTDQVSESNKMLKVGDFERAYKAAAKFNDKDLDALLEKSGYTDNDIISSNFTGTASINSKGKLSFVFKIKYPSGASDKVEEGSVYATYDLDKHSFIEADF